MVFLMMQDHRSDHTRARDRIIRQKYSAGRKTPTKNGMI